MAQTSAWAMNGCVQHHGALGDLTPDEAERFATQLIAAAREARAWQSLGTVPVVYYPKLARTPPAGREPPPRDPAG